MEVRYERLRPEQIAQRRREKPVAYLPLGTLEWHGRHLPVGNDTLKAHALCVRFAQAIGGLAMPPLYFGDNRAEIAEVVFKPERFSHLQRDHTVGIAEAYGLSPAAFLKEAERTLARGGWAPYEALLVSIFSELESLGFRLTVAITGHYPLQGPASRAAEEYSKTGEMKVLTFIGFDLVKDLGYQGDHAARWETSMLMALEPDLVNISALGAPAADGFLGVLGPDPRQASAEYAEEAIAAMTERLRTHVDEALRG